MAQKNVKKRYWAFVGYPESLPENWLQVLQESGLQCAISPLHNRDLDPTGETKKAHYHVILAYAGPTTYNSVKRLTDSLNCPIPQPLEQVKGYFRYLTHKDNPEKAQYDEADIQCINGFNILDFSELTRSEVQQIMDRIEDLIRSADLFEYGDVLELLADNGMSAEREVFRGHTIHFNAYLRSRRHRNGQASSGDQ